jgi:ATP-dependent phosphofructokinase / diphosphate-dependent phosphofructokinase
VTGGQINYPSEISARGTHNIRYFLQIGGREALESSLKLHEEAVKRGYEMRIIGIPKSLENELPNTDAAPGCGSAIKFCATTVLEIATELRNSNEKGCCIVEVAGSATGWVPAGTILAKRSFGRRSAYHTPAGSGFRPGKFPQASEDHDGELQPVPRGGGRQVLPHRHRAGGRGLELAAQLADLIQQSLNLKPVTVKLGAAQRSAAHLASATDSNNALALGAAAVRAAASGQSGLMVKTTRQTAEDGSREMVHGSARPDRSPGGRSWCATRLGVR